MTGYIGKRVLLLIPTLLGVSVLTFLLIHLIPGDLVTILLGITASQNEQTRQALIHALHLDRPLAVQYLLWLGEVLRGDLGESLRNKIPVSELLASKLPVTLELAVCSMAIQSGYLRGVEDGAERRCKCASHLCSGAWCKQWRSGPTGRARRTRRSSSRSV